MSSPSDWFSNGMKPVLVAVVFLALRNPVMAAKGTAAGEWPEIPAAEKALTSVKEDPTAAAVVLLNERNGKILRRADEWVNVLDYHWRLKVLTDEGKEYGEVRIPHSKYSRVSNIRGRTVRPDGTVVEVDPGQIFESEVLRVGSYRLTEHVFNFPAVEPGAILEFRYDRHDNLLLFIDPFFFEGPEVTLRAKVMQAIPEEMGYQILCSRCPPGTEPKLGRWVEGPAKGKKYDLELLNRPGYRDEIFMPPRRDVSPRLEMNLHTWKGHWSEALGRESDFFKDWDSVALYTDYYYRKAIREGFAQMKTVAGAWVEGIEDPAGRIRAILGHVQRDFRYIPYDSVVGGTRPIKVIVESGLADNEEKAVLLMAALEAVGIRSDATLVAGKQKGTLNPNFFSFSQFSHTIVAVPQADGSTMWLDPTVAYAAAGFVPSKNSGAQVLLIKDRTGKVSQLPTKNEASATRYEVTLKPRADGLSEMTLVAELTGEDAIDLREELIPISETARKERLERWLKNQQEGSMLGPHTFENLEDPDKPLVVRLTAEVKGLVTQADELLLVRGCVLSGYASNPLGRTRRQHEVQVNRGWNDQETVIIVPPEGMEAVDVPPTRKADGGIARLTFHCTTTLEGTVRCSRVFTCQRGRWDAGKMAQLQKMFDGVVEADRTMIAFQPKEAAEAAATSGGE